MTLRLHRDVDGGCLTPQGSVVAIGAFDGLHLGHQAILAQVRQRAADKGLAPAVISFDPLPRAFFSKEPVPRLSGVREKAEGMSAAGMVELLSLRFDEALTKMSAEDFVRQVIVGRLAAREVWVGEDFRFGHRRGGDFALLQAMGAELGFTAHAVAPVLVDGERVSSSKVRSLLAESRFADAAVLLGRPFVIDGHVEHGKQLGRELGYPTANVHLRDRVSPIQGIFAVRIGVGDGPCSWPGVASLGFRPTVNEVSEPLLEAHLFDFSGDLYDQTIGVELIDFLRPEWSLPDLDALRLQIAADCEAARSRLAAEGGAH